MNGFNNESLSNKELKRQATVKLAIWSSAWLVTMFIATFGPILIWDSSLSWLTVLAVIFNLFAGLGWIFSNVRYLKSLDELMQKIHMESLALTLGVFVVTGFCYYILSSKEILNLDKEILYLSIIGSATYIGGIFTGKRRYS